MKTSLPKSLRAAAAVLSMVLAGAACSAPSTPQPGLSPSGAPAVTASPTIATTSPTSTPLPTATLTATPAPTWVPARVSLADLPARAFSDVVIGDDCTAMATAPSPDLSMMAAEAESVIYLWNTATSSVRRTLDVRKLTPAAIGWPGKYPDYASKGVLYRTLVNWVVWSPDSKTISISVGSAAYLPVPGGGAYALPDVVFLWDAATGKVLHALIGPDKEVWTTDPPLFSSDSTTLFTVSSFNENVIAWDVASGEQVGRYSTGGVAHMFLSPDGARFAVMHGLSTSEGSLEILDSLTGKQIHAFEERWRSDRDVAWSADGARLTVVGDTEPDVDNLIVWDTATWQRVYAVKADIAHGDSIEWSSDGRRFVISDLTPAYDYYNSIWSLWGASTGSRIANLDGGFGRFSSDGTVVFTSARNSPAVMLSDANIGGTFLTIEGLPGNWLTIVDTRWLDDATLEMLALSVTSVGDNAQEDCSLHTRSLRYGVLRWSRTTGAFEAVGKTAW